VIHYSNALSSEEILFPAIYTLFFADKIDKFMR
jgi:hypothetical protein